MNVKINKVCNIKIISIIFILFSALIEAQKLGDITSSQTLIQGYKKRGYDLFFQRDYSFSTKQISIYVFEKAEHRELLLTEKLATNRKKVIGFNENLIYPKTSDCSSIGFKRIVQKGRYFTIEENFCTNRRGQYLKEYFTFKYSDEDNTFLLHKYSFNLVNILPSDDRLPPRNYIEDEFPTENYTEKDFGKMKINDFDFNPIQTIRDSYLQDK